VHLHCPGATGTDAAAPHHDFTPFPYPYPYPSPDPAPSRPADSLSGPDVRVGQNSFGSPTCVNF